MKKFILSALMGLSALSAQANCFGEAYEHFEKKHPKLRILTVESAGILKPQEERLFRDFEAFNATASTLELYLIESSFMVRIIHLAMMEKETCRLHRMVEIGMED